jgi:O-antigen ligase
MQLQPSSALTAFPWSNRFLVFLIIIGCFFSIAAGIVPLIVWGAVAALGLLFWCFTSSLKGLVLVIALSSMFVRSTEEITPFEIAYTVLFGVVVMGWILRRMSLGLPFTQNTSDRVLGWFLFICIASILPAIGQGNDLIKWVRELVPFLLFLPYFMVVSLLRSKEEIRWFCIAYLVLSISMGLVNVYDYWIIVSEATQEWELIANRQAPGEPLFFTTLIITILFLVYHGVWARRTIVFLGIIAFCVIALAITFSRGYWVGSIIALGCAYLYMPSDKKRRFILYIGSMTLVAVIVIVSLMGQIIIDIVSAMGDRLASIITASMDLSIRNRMVESAAAMDEILASPIWGYGLGYHFNFHPLIPYLTPTWYVHNVYLYLWLKLGIFGLSAFLIWYGMVLYHAYLCVRRLSDPFLHPLVLGIMCIMIAMIPLSITSPQFIQKDSILFLALGTGIIERIYRSNNWTAPLEA